MESQRSKIKKWGWLWGLAWVMVWVGIWSGGEAQARDMVYLCVPENSTCNSCGKIQYNGVGNLFSYSSSELNYGGCSGGVCPELQDAINAAVSDAAMNGKDHTITITKEATYSNLSNGQLNSGMGFSIPYPNLNADTARNCKLIIQGRYNLEREDVVLHNPTGKIPRGYSVPTIGGAQPGSLAVPLVIGAEFSVIGTGKVLGMPMYLKHLTVAGSNMLLNPSFEDTRAKGAYHSNGSSLIASGWSSSNNIVGIKYVGDPGNTLPPSAAAISGAVNVLAGPSSWDIVTPKVFPKAQGFNGSSDYTSCIYTVVPLRSSQTYNFSAWIKRVSGSGTVNVMLSTCRWNGVNWTGDTQIYSVASTAPTFVKVRHQFALAGTNQGLRIRFYANDSTATTTAALDEVSVDAPLINGVMFKGPAKEEWTSHVGDTLWTDPNNSVLFSNNLQGVEDCVIRNIGYRVGLLDNPDPTDCNHGNPDVNCDENDDVLGHGLYIAGGANPLVGDNDIRNNYDGVVVWDASWDKDRYRANPRFWCNTGNSNHKYYLYTPGAVSANSSQRIRLNERFGMGIRYGASPFVGRYWLNDPGYPVPAYNGNPNKKAHAGPGAPQNMFQANGFAAIGAQENCQPWILNNWFTGTFDVRLVSNNGYYPRVPYPGSYGLLFKDTTRPVVWQNRVIDFNRAGIGCKDDSTPVLGAPLIPAYGVMENLAVTSPKNKTDYSVNIIKYCNYFANMPTNDYRFSTHMVYCGYAAFDNLDCAAVAATGGARPVIQRNWISYNYWVGIGARDWATPTVYANWIERNQIGMAYMSVRDSAIYVPKIGGRNEPDSWIWSSNPNLILLTWRGNVIFDNQIGIALDNAGSRLTRVDILGNRITDNLDPNLGVGIGLSNSYAHIAENFIYNNGMAEVPQTKAGIGVFNNSDAVICSNNILNNIGAGIGVLDATADIHGNLIVDNYPGKCAPGSYSGPQPQVMAASRDNYFFNGGFEPMSADNNVTTGVLALNWRKSGNMDVQMYSVIHFEGKWCQRIGNFIETGNSLVPSTDYIYANVMVARNAQYEFTVHAKAGPGTPGESKVYVTLYDPEYDVVYSRLIKPVPAYNTNTWLETTFRFADNPEYDDAKGRWGKKTYSSYLQVRLGVNTKDGKDILVDGLTLRKTYNTRGSKVKIDNNIIMGDVTCQLTTPPNQYQVTGIHVQGGSRLLECKNNIIGRSRLGVHVATGATGDPWIGNVDPPGVVDANAVDYNLVYAWDHSRDSDGCDDGYLMSGAQPGEHTYQAGEVYSNNVRSASPPTPYIPTSIYSAYKVTPFFADPDHSSLYTRNSSPVYAVRSSSLIYSYTSIDNYYRPYLGLAASFKYPPRSFQFFWYYGLNMTPDVQPPFCLFAVGPKDRKGPILRGIWPGSGDTNVSYYPTVVAFIEDQGLESNGMIEGGEGILASSIMFSVKVNGVEVNTAIKSIRPDYPPGAGRPITKAGRYKIIWHPDDGTVLQWGSIVSVIIRAKDMLGNSLDTATYFQVEAGMDTYSPYVLTSEMSFSTVTSNRADAPLEFSLRDDKVGVDMNTARMKVYSGSEVYYDGLIYSGWSNPKYLATVSNVNYRNNRISFRRPDGRRFPYGKDITLEVWANDFDGIPFHGTWVLPIENDTYPPEEAGYFLAKAVGTSTVSLTWDPSVDAPMEGRDLIDGDLAKYELYYLRICQSCDPHNWVKINEPSNVSSSVTVVLPTGEYRFRLRGVDIYGNKSMGQLANRSALNPYGSSVKLISGRVFENFDGFSDDFTGAMLDKWLMQGDASFSTNGGSGNLQVAGTDGELIAAGYQAGDFVCSAKATLGAGGRACLLLRKTAETGVGASGYAASIDVSTKNVGFYKLPDTSTLYPVNVPKPGLLPPGDYLIEVRVHSNRFKLSVSTPDQSIIVTRSYVDPDSTYNLGQIGIWKPANGTGTASYDYIVVRDLRDRWTGTGGNGINLNGDLGWEGNWITSGPKSGAYPTYQLIPRTGNGKLVLKDYSTPENFMLTADITFNSTAGGGGLMFRDHAAPNDENGKLFSAYGAWLDGNGVHLYKFDGIGASTLLASASYPSPLTFATGNAYHLKVEANGGGQIGVYICSAASQPYDYQRVLGYTNNEYNGGYFGVWQKDGKTGVRYDNFYFGDAYSSYYQPYQMFAGSAIHTVNSANPAQNVTGYVQGLIDQMNTGDTLLFSGDWIFTTTISLKAGVSMRGKGRGITHIRSSARTIVEMGEGCTIEGFTIIGSNCTNVGIYAASVNALIINNEVTSCSDGIRVGGQRLTQSTVALNWVHHNARLGIGVAVSTMPWITENKIWANYVNGIGVGDQNEAPVPYITLNVIGSSGGSFQPLTANGNKCIAVSGFSKPYIIRNEISHAAEHGIGASGDTKVRIEGNNIYDNDHFGIGAYENAQLEITNGNRIHNNEIGIGCKNNVILNVTSNFIYSNSTVGIGGWDNSVLNISQNGIYHNDRQGIGVGGHSSVYSNETQIFSGTLKAQYNTIYSNFGGGFLGRQIRGSGTVNILNNTINGNVNWDGPAGIGVGGHRLDNPTGGARKTAGTINIKGNHISGNNVVFSKSEHYDSYDISAGIGITDLDGASIYIVNNVLEGNNSIGSSAVMGIGVAGKSSIHDNRSVVANLIIASNSVYNHLSDNVVSSAAAIGVKWINIDNSQQRNYIYIRNNAPDRPLGDITDINRLNKRGLYNNQFGINLNQNGVLLPNSVYSSGIMVYGNYVYSQKNNGISARNNELPIVIWNNVLDNRNVASKVQENVYVNTGGSYGIEVLASVICSHNGLWCSSDWPSMTIYSNWIQNFGMSGMRAQRYTQGLKIQNNSISNCGLRYFLYPRGSDMGNGAICSPYGKPCPAASGIQLLNDWVGESGDSYIIGNTITYNKFAGISTWNTRGKIGPGNKIYENGSLYTIPGFIGAYCATCISLSDADPRGDAGVSVGALDNSQVHLIVSESIFSTEIYSNHPGNVRVKPFTPGAVTHCEKEGQPGERCKNINATSSTGGPVDGFGWTRDCTDPRAATWSIQDGGCNGVYSNQDIAVQGKARFGILVRGPYSYNLRIKDNTVAYNMLTSNAGNLVCSGVKDANGNDMKSHEGGGIALLCGAMPRIYRNTIRHNGAAPARPVGKGSHSGINIMLPEWSDPALTQMCTTVDGVTRCAGNALIYSNKIYGNANDGIDVRVYSSCWTGAPQIGVAGQQPNQIYSNGRMGIGIQGIWSTGDSTKISISNNNIHSNNAQGIGFYQFIGNVRVENNVIHHNGLDPIENGAAGGIAGRKMQPGTTVTIHNNQIYSNYGRFGNGIGFKND